MEHVHISTKISKLGTGIPALNLPAGITCRTDVPCKKKCYACKGHFIFNNVKESCMRNFRIWQNDPIRFEKEVAGIAQFAQYFRWHSSGDIVNGEYLQMMVRVAKECRATKFLAFTKQYEIVNAYLNAGNLLPDNLSIVYSAWGDFIPENPHNLPMAYVRFKKRKVSNSRICYGMYRLLRRMCERKKLLEHEQRRSGSIQRTLNTMQKF